MRIFVVMFCFFFIFLSGAQKAISQKTKTKAQSSLPKVYKDYEDVFKKSLSQLLKNTQTSAKFKNPKVMTVRQANFFMPLSTIEREYLLVVVSLEERFGNFDYQYALLFKKQDSKIEWVKTSGRDFWSGGQESFSFTEFIDLTNDNIPELVLITEGDFAGGIDIIDLLHEKPFSAWQKLPPVGENGCEFFTIIKKNGIVVKETECDTEGETLRTTRYHWDEKQKAMVPVK